MNNAKNEAYSIPTHSNFLVRSLFFLNKDLKIKCCNNIIAVSSRDLLLLTIIYLKTFDLPALACQQSFSPVVTLDFPKTQSAASQRLQDTFSPL